MKKLLALLLLPAHVLMAQVSFYPSANASGNAFGAVVSADENRFLVSSGSTPMAAGKVYLFEKNAAIAQVATFSQTDGMLTDGFGQSLSVSGNMIAIGAQQHNFTGAVYTYQKTGGSWNFLQKLIPLGSDLDDCFGQVKIDGNYLFVGSSGSEPDGLPNTSDSGLIYVYHFNGNLWVLHQELTVANSFRLGLTIKTFGDRMVASSQGENGGMILHSFLMTDGQWQHEASTESFGSSVYPVDDFSLSDDGIYLIERENIGTHIIRRINTDDWTETSLVTFSSFDQIYNRLEVAGDRMFVGSSAYILQLQRKFPVLFYNYDGSNWNYQSTLYSNAVESIDDYFGYAMTHSGQNLIVGAPTENIFGKTYYIDMLSLSTQSFSAESLAIYPNPATSILNISCENPVESVQIFSATGNLCLSAKGPLDSIDVQRLAAGLYMAKIPVSGQPPTTIKFLKN